MVGAGRIVVTMLVVVLGAGVGQGTAIAEAPARDPFGTWTGTWEAAPSGTATAHPGASFRNVVHLSVGGSATRVRLTNRLGSAPLRLDAVTVALREAGPDAVAGFDARRDFRRRADGDDPGGRGPGQ